jgi:hypothetical protein
MFFFGFGLSFEENQSSQSTQSGNYHFMSYRTFHHDEWKVQQKAAVATLCVLCGVHKHALKGAQKMAGPQQAVAALAPEPELGQRNSPEYLMIFSLLSSVFPLLY